MASVVLALLATIYFLTYVWRYADDFSKLDWHTGDGLLLGAATLIWVGVIGFGAAIWKMLLGSLGHPRGWLDCLTIYALAQFGKYLPGNVGHHVGRVIMASRVGVPAVVTLQTQVIEMAWAIGVAAGVALLGLWLLLGDVPGPGGIATNGLLLLALVAGALLLPRGTLWLAQTLLPRKFARISGGAVLSPPGNRVMVAVGLLYLLTFLMVGLLLDLLARYGFDAANSHVLMLTTIFAWSWIAGYLSPGAPAGLGVREAVMVSMLTPIYGGGTAVGLGLALRVVTTLGDGLAFLLGLAARRFLRAHYPAAKHADPEIKL